MLESHLEDGVAKAVASQSNAQLAEAVAAAGSPAYIDQLRGALSRLPAAWMAAVGLHRVDELVDRFAAEVHRAASAVASFPIDRA
jgi:hypothetical protein